MPPLNSLTSASTSTAAWLIRPVSLAGFAWNTGPAALVLVWVPYRSRLIAGAAGLAYVLGAAVENMGLLDAPLLGAGGGRGASRARRPRCGCGRLRGRRLRRAHPHRRGG